MAAMAKINVEKSKIKAEDNQKNQLADQKRKIQE